MRVSRGPRFLCGGCWLWFRGAGMSEGGVGPPPGDGNLSPANHVIVDRPLVVGGLDPAEGGGWSRNGRLAGCQPRAPVPTSPFWVGPPGVGNLSPANHVIVDRPLVSGGLGPQKVGVGPETGGWPGVNHGAWTAPRGHCPSCVHICRRRFVIPGVHHGGEQKGVRRWTLRMTKSK